MIVANHVTVQLHLSETYVQSQLRYAAKIASRESRRQQRRLEAIRPPGDAGDDADMTAADDDESDSHDDLAHPPSQRSSITCPSVYASPRAACQRWREWLLCNRPATSQVRSRAPS
jgi:hypothetical protein